MDSKINKRCPNCDRFYRLKSSSTKQNVDIIPLLQNCGHSMCENCITNMIKFGVPIECKTCHKNTEIPSDDLAKLRHFIPVNKDLCEELSLDYLQISPESNDKMEKDDINFLDIKELVHKMETQQGQCLECKITTTKMCKQCDTVLCDVCFNKTHKNFFVLKTHVLRDIDVNLSLDNCKVHTECTLEYYCKDCSRQVCMDCVFNGDMPCRYHNLTAPVETNENLLKDLIDIIPKVDEIYKRLNKTAVDVGKLIKEIENGGTSEMLQTEKEVEESSSNITNIETQKDETINKIEKIKTAKKESLENAKISVAESIKNTEHFLNSINNAMNMEKKQQGNMLMFLEEAKKIIKSPWYLSHDKAEIKVVNEEVSNLLANVDQLEGETGDIFKLQSTEEIDPSVEIPPLLAEGVRPPEQDKIPKSTSSDLQQKVNLDQESKDGNGAAISSPNSTNETAEAASTSEDVARSGPSSSQVTSDPGVQEPKALRPGGQDVVRIINMMTPHHFYVHRVHFMSMLEDLTKELAKAAPMPKPAVKKVVEGKLYTAFNKIMKAWQRCRITKVDKTDPKRHYYHVYFFDYGRTDIITIDKLRPRITAQAHLPPFAIKCSLVNCKPYLGVWSSEEMILIQKIVDHKDVVLHIYGVQSTDDGVSLDCDITTYEDNISLTHALVYQGRAVICDTNIPEPRNEYALNKPKLLIDNSSFLPITTENVFITCITNPEKFYIRKSNLQKVYEELSEELDQNYNLNVKIGMIYLPTKGMLCVVNLEMYEVPEAHTNQMRVKWARCVVTKVLEDGRVRVSLPDCGVRFLAHWSTLRRILDKFTTISALANLCHLSGVTPPNGTWTPSSGALLQTFRGLELRANIDDVGTSLSVTLYDNTDTERIICINQQMIKCKYALPTGSYNFKNENEKRNEEEGKVENNTNKTNEVKTDEIPECSVKKEELEVEDEDPEKEEVEILSSDSPSLIYITFLKQAQKLSDLYMSLHKYYARRKATKSDWKIGDKCCARCRDVGMWRRSEIVGFVDGLARLHFIDFARTQSVFASSLMEMKEEFMAIPPAAIKCHLAGIEPAGSKDWANITKEYMNRLIYSHKKVFVVTKGDMKDTSLPIELWVQHARHVGALCIDNSEWMCVNDKIVEQGLAIPTKSQQDEATSDEAKSEDNAVEVHNVKGSVEQMLQGEPILYPYNWENTLMDRQDIINALTRRPENWVPPYPPQFDEFEGVPTAVDDEGLVFILPVENKETLDIMQKYIYQRYKTSAPKANESWRLGELCVAHSEKNGMYYRGRIDEVSIKNASCLVHYIDIGSTNICKFSHLRKSIPYHQVPTQVLKCLLSDIESIDRYWEEKTLDYIRRSIIDKVYNVEVTTDPICRIYPVRLKYYHLIFNRHLVEMGMARYRDGTVAPGRRRPPVVEKPKDDPTASDSDSDSSVSSGSDRL